MRIAHYAVSASRMAAGMLQLWSERATLIRTGVDVQERAQCLRIMTRRMGAAKPQALELVPTSDRRTPTARDALEKLPEAAGENADARFSLKGGRIAVGKWTWSTALGRLMCADCF